MTSQEDDATELQFPKDLCTSILSLRTQDNEPCCSFCSEALQFPYIQCSYSQCFKDKVTLCLFCFAKGMEFDGHRNDHDYIVVKNTPIFTMEWKAKEEIQLLNAIMESGLGNWSDISKSLNNKSAEDCKNHYLHFYVNNPCPELAALVEKTTNSSTVKSNLFYPVFGTDDPPRPVPCSAMFREMAGYNAARGDFTVEYLNEAENIIQDIDFSLFENEENSLGQALQVALIDIYRRELGERWLKKKVIREHGLINPGKVGVSHNYYKNALPNFSEIIAPLYLLFSHEEFIYFLESFSYEEELKLHIRELKECRINGLTKQSQVSIYDTMKKKREILKRRKHKLVLGGELSDAALREMLRSNTVSSLKRRRIPLDITGEAEYETLSTEEQEISSSLRILPRRFNAIKYGMIEECRKLNGLQLRHARSYFKIDVNKIRKIYDYLLGEGHIYRPIPTK